MADQSTLQPRLVALASAIFSRSAKVALTCVIMFATARDTLSGRAGIPQDQALDAPGSKSQPSRTLGATLDTSQTPLSQTNTQTTSQTQAAVPSKLETL
jgi:hypothetical protein